MSEIRSKYLDKDQKRTDSNSSVVIVPERHSFSYLLAGYERQSGSNSAHVHDALQQQQAVNGYSVAAPVVHHHHHQHQQPISNGYTANNHQHQQPVVDGYAVGHDFHQKRKTEAPTIPVHNLNTVDAYQSVPGGVLLNDPLPSNQYYGGKIGERQEAPTECTRQGIDTEQRDAFLDFVYKHLEQHPILQADTDAHAKITHLLDYWSKEKKHTSIRAMVMDLDETLKSMPSFNMMREQIKQQFLENDPFVSKDQSPPTAPIASSACNLELNEHQHGSNKLHQDKNEKTSSWGWSLPNFMSRKDTTAEKSTGNPGLIVLGNPGVGKSTFLNCIAEQNLFESGLSWGSGMTSKIDKKSVNNMDYIDLPGLADIQYGKRAGSMMDDVFAKGGDLKILFFIKEDEGRIVMQDIIIMQIILDAHPEIQNNFGIVVNKVDKEYLLKLYEDENGDKLHNFLAPIYFDMKPENMSNKIILLPKQPILHRQRNKHIPLREIHPNLSHFISEIPYVKTKSRSSGIDSKLINKRLQQHKQKISESQANELERTEAWKLQEALGRVPFEFAKDGLKALFD